MPPTPIKKTLDQELAVEAYKSTRTEIQMRVQIAHQSMTVAIALLSANTALAASLGAAGGFPLGRFYPYVFMAYIAICGVFGQISVGHELLILDLETYVRVTLTKKFSSLQPSEDGSQWDWLMPICLQNTPISLAGGLYFLIGAVAFTLIPCGLLFSTPSNNEGINWHPIRLDDFEIWFLYALSSSMMVTYFLKYRDLQRRRLIRKEHKPEVNTYPPIVNKNVE